jgi:hypothetical protein
MGRVRDLVSTSIYFGGSSGRVTRLRHPNSEVSGSQRPCHVGPHPRRYVGSLWLPDCCDKADNRASLGYFYALDIKV